MSDEPKRHDVVVTFHLLEEVTPRIFLTRVLEACGRYGALREGEGASATTVDTYTVLKNPHNVRADVLDFIGDVEADIAASKKRRKRKAKREDR